MVSALTLYSPVFVSSVKVREGAAAVPLAKLNTPEMVGESFKDKVTDDPRVTSPPPLRLVPAETVTLLLVKAELGMLVRVLDEPDRLLLVKVWVVSMPTRVVVAAGKVIVWPEAKVIWF